MKSLIAALTSAFLASAPVTLWAQDWSGPYVGLTFGQGSGDVQAPASFDLDGESYGIVVGYNIQSGALVYGGELAYHNASVDLVSAAPFVQRYEELLDLKARIGYASGKLLAYGVLGYSTNEYNLNNTVTSTGGGISYGLGVDYNISDAVFVGAEYLRRNMDNDAVVPGINALDANLSTLSVRVGVSF